MGVLTFKLFWSLPFDISLFLSLLLNTFQNTLPKQTKPFTLNSKCRLRKNTTNLKWQCRSESCARTSWPGCSMSTGQRSGPEDSNFVVYDWRWCHFRLKFSKGQLGVSCVFTPHFLLLLLIAHTAFTGDTCLCLTHKHKSHTHTFETSWKTAKKKTKKKNLSSRCHCDNIASLTLIRSRWLLA